MQKIDVLPMGEHEYSVALTEGYDTTHHHVTVSTGLLEDLAVTDERRLVREAMEYLLERSPADAVPDEIDLGDLSARSPDFNDEIVSRLSS